MTIEEWAKDFKSYVNELEMPRDDYKGIMEYIDDALALLKEQEAVVRCKDCKHYRINTFYPGTNMIMTYCAKTGLAENNRDWFCADRERKDESP